MFLGLNNFSFTAPEMDVDSVRVAIVGHSHVSHIREDLHSQNFRLGPNVDLTFVAWSGMK